MSFSFPHPYALDCACDRCFSETIRRELEDESEYYRQLEASAAVYSDWSDLGIV